MTMTVASGSRDFADPRIPNRNECVLRYLVDRWADERPDKTHVIFEDGEEWSYAELRRRVVSKAAGLQRLGVRQGDHVAAWLPLWRPRPVTSPSDIMEILRRAA